MSIRALLLGSLCIFSLSAPSIAAPQEDAFARWQQQDARNKMLDEEKALLQQEAKLKRDLVELQLTIEAAVRKRAFVQEDLANVQRSILSVKMRLL